MLLVSDPENDLPFASLVDAPTDYAGVIEPAYFQQRNARKKFLEAVEQLVLAFLTTLRDEVFPTYAKACVSENTHADICGPIPIGWLEIDRMSRLPSAGKRFAALRKKILTFAKQFHLTVRHPELETAVPAAWACDVIAVTLWHWQQDPTMMLHFPFESDRFGYGDWVAALVARRYTLDVPARGPSPNESFAKFEGRVLPEIRKQLHHDWKAARGRGASGKEKTAEQHFRWFASFQIGGLSPRAIVGREYFDPPTIQHSLAPTARLLGLTPRSVPRGRPKKRI